jgi:hypothetical protein
LVTKTGIEPMESRRDDALIATKVSSLRDFLGWYGFHGFHRWVRIFLEFLLETQAKKQKKSVPIGVIREIRTSILSLFLII